MSLLMLSLALFILVPMTLFFISDGIHTEDALLKSFAALLVIVDAWVIMNIISQLGLIGFLSSIV